MPVVERSGYRATFVGGILDGQTFRVPSLAPTRLARHGRRYAGDGVFPQAQRYATPPPGTFDSYDAGYCPPEGEPGCDEVTYTFVRTIRRAG